MFFGKFLQAAKRAGFDGLVSLKAFFWDLLDPTRSTAANKQRDQRTTDFGAAKVFLRFHRCQGVAIHFEYVNCPSCQRI